MGLLLRHLAHRVLAGMTALIVIFECGMAATGFRFKL
jgi:hypothetical protein